VELGIAAIFRQPTVAGLAAHLGEATPARARPALRRSRRPAGTQERSPA